ncbi:hypothetical protein N7E02_21070 [Aliirhizobium terrae]|uniref:hypothetical protein n=1 Tax=Terrirhizobium terrae TaxID=2926709 RepID=UPI00257686F7|nr:hypothetical protein [Rhizobium sp. CC-CFT758]WJH39324.1 hypothetical protein N7E02_21070 [Rhizobium sp. CC-CFT758]
MKIDSGLSGYQYPNRTVEVQRKQEEVAPRETATTARFPGALTGSSTLLSSSLASALWAVEAGDTDSVPSQQAPVAQEWVRDVFQEFN